MRPLEVLLSRLRGVRPSSLTTGRAVCPAHGTGRKQTLAYRELDDGRVLVHCFAECDPLDILAALGMDMSDLFPRRTWPAHPHPRERFNAQDVLGAIVGEVTVVTATVRAVRDGEVLDAHAWARFDLAVARLVAAEGFANG